MFSIVTEIHSSLYGCNGSKDMAVFVSVGYWSSQMDICLKKATVSDSFNCHKFVAKSTLKGCDHFLKGIWTKLPSLHMTVLRKQSVSKEEAYTYYMSPGMKLGDHIDEFNKLILDLANIDIEIKDEDQTLMLHTSLPSSYEKFMETLLYGRESLTMKDVLANLNSRKLKKRTEGLVICKGKDHIKRDYPMKKSNGFIKKGKRDQDSNSSDDEGNAYFGEALLVVGNDKMTELVMDLGVHRVHDEKRVWLKIDCRELKRIVKLRFFGKRYTLVQKVGANIMGTKVPGQEGAEGSVAKKKKVKESKKLI
nr:retrovirus-related Pol polyprotein from transposon TNT 1-94 [Tanacetum cinerariifolium]